MENAECGLRNAECAFLVPLFPAPSRRQPETADGESRLLCGILRSGTSRPVVRDPVKRDRFVAGRNGDFGVRNARGGKKLRMLHLQEEVKPCQGFRMVLLNLDKVAKLKKLLHPPV